MGGHRLAPLFLRLDDNALRRIQAGPLLRSSTSEAHPGPHRHDPDRAVCDLPLESFLQPPLNPSSAQREEQRKPQQIGQHSWREQKRTTYQDRRTVEHRLARQSTLRQLLLKLKEHTQAFGSRHCGSADAGRDDQRQRGHYTNELPELDEQHQLDDRDDNEEQSQSAKCVHIKALPARAPAGFKTLETSNVSLGTGCQDEGYAPV